MVYSAQSALFPADEVQAVAHHVHQAELHRRLGEHTFNCIGETRQTINAGDEDVDHTTILQYRDQLQAELCPFCPGHRPAECLLDAIQIDANGKVRGPDPDRAVVAHFDVNAVHVEDGVKRIQKRDCQALASSMTASVTDESKVGETSAPYISSRWR